MKATLVAWLGFFRRDIPFFHRSATAVLCILGTVLCGTKLLAADVTWIGPSGGLYEDTNNWSTHALPTSTDRAVFNGASNTNAYSVVFTNNVTVGNVLFNASTTSATWQVSNQVWKVNNSFVVAQPNGATAVGLLNSGITTVTNGGAGVLQIGGATNDVGTLQLDGTTNVMPTLIIDKLVLTNNVAPISGSGATLSFRGGTLTTLYGSTINAGTQTVVAIGFASASGLSLPATWNMLGGSNIFQLSSTGEVRLAYQSGNSARVLVNVSGSNTVWSMPNTGTFSIGWNQMGGMSVSGGAVVTNAGGCWMSGNGAAATNCSAVVTDARSRWDIGSNLTVGFAARNCSLVVSNGGIVNVAGTIFRLGDGTGASNCVATVTGSNSVLNVGMDAQMGASGPSNNLAVQNGGQLNCVSNLFIGLKVGGSNNVVVISGTNSLLQALRTVYVGYGGGGDQLSVTNAGALRAASLEISSSNSLNNSVVLSGGLISATNAGSTGTLRIGGGGVTGTLTFNGGTINADQLFLTNGAASVFQFNAGVLNVSSSQVANASTFVVGNGSSAATLKLLGASHSYANGLSISSNATLSGIGTILGNVTLANGAIWSPGLGAGTQAVVGAVALNPGTVLDYGFGAPGGAVDLVTITGNLTLDGTLNVTDLGGFSSNSTYTVFSYTGTLTNNTLNMGTMPLGYSGTISNDSVHKLVLLKGTCNVGAAGAISGSSSVCSGQSGVGYSISSVSGASTYTWTVPSGASIASGQGTTAITVNWGSTGGNVTVTPSNGNGCSGTSSSLGVTVNSVGAAGAISGLSSVVSGTNGVGYSISAVSGASTYTWTVPSGASVASGQGTTAITVNYGCNAANGNVSVTPSNTNGCSGTSSSLGITVTSVGAAGAISGSSSVCSGSSGVGYSISSVSGASTYTWTVTSGASVASGQGTTAITVNWGSTGGNVKVTPSNANGCTGTSNSLAVTVNTPPSITGQPTSQTVYTNANASFSVTATGTGLTYQWQKNGTSINNGGTISGATSATLTLTGVAATDSGGTYDCVVSGTSCPSVTSSGAFLMVIMNMSAPSPRIFGYYSSQDTDSYPYTTIDFTQLTYIAQTWVQPTTNGVLNLTLWSYYPELVNAAHSNNVKILAGLGGLGTASIFTKMSSNAVARAAFVANVKQFCLTNHYDGADFDWEAPASQADKTNFSALVQQMRAAFNTTNPPLTTLTSAVRAGPNDAKWVDLGGLTNYLDCMNILTYDFHGTWSFQSGHNSPLYGVPNGTQLGVDHGTRASVDGGLRWYLTNGVPRTNLLLGTPFYAYQFASTNLYATNVPAASISLVYSQVLNEISAGWTQEWDSTCLVPWLQDPAHTNLVSYDNDISIQYKADYAINHAGGSMIWLLGQDLNSVKTNEMLEILGQNVLRASNTVALVDVFEGSVSPFTNAPTDSPSTVGISSNSTAHLTNSVVHTGTNALMLTLMDDPSTNANWSVCFLSGGGSPAGQPNIANAEYVGYWLNTATTNQSVGIAVNAVANSTTNTYHSVVRYVVGDALWHFFEWDIKDPSQWDRGTNAPGDSAFVTLNSLWFYAPDSSQIITNYIDDVYVINVNSIP